MVQPSTESVPRPSFSERKRQAVLDGAAQVFIEEGFQAASMDRIAAAAGVSKRTVYKHFHSKRELFDSFVAIKWGELTIWVLEPMQIDNDPKEELLRFAAHMLGRLLDPSALKIVRMVVSEFLRDPDLGRDFFQKTSSLGLDELSTYLSLATERGLLRVEDPDLAAGQFHALIKDSIFWPCLMGMTRGSAMQEQRILEDAVELFIARYGVH